LLSHCPCNQESKQKGNSEGTKAGRNKVLHPFEKAREKREKFTHTLVTDRTNRANAKKTTEKHPFMREDASHGAELRINWCESAEVIRIASTLWV
jgi:hypothetical protein